LLKIHLLKNNPVPVHAMKANEIEKASDMHPSPRHYIYVTGQLHVPADLPQGKDDKMLVPVAARSKAWVCGRSPEDIVGSKPTGGHGCLPVVSVVCCQVEVSGSGCSPDQRSPTKCGTSLCVI